MHIHLHRSRRLAAAIALACSPLLAAAQGRATVEILQHPATGAGGTTFVSAINDAGWVLGQFGGTPWIYKGQGGYEVLPLPDSPIGVYTFDMNEAGWVAGRSNFQPALWRPGTEPVLLEGNAFLQGINNQGWAVGTDPGCCSGVTNLWIYRPDGSRVQLATPVLGLREALDINDQREAVGYSGGQALRWQSDGSATVLPWTGLAEARAINNRGVVIGRGLQPGVGWRAVMWDASGSLMHTFEHDRLTLAAAVRMNDANQAVGSGRLGSRDIPYLWNPTHGRTDLGPLLGAGLVSGVASGINNRAQIAGRAHSVALDMPVGYLLTLHPDWEGGSGHWDSATNWNWGGTGVAAVRVAAVHEAVIDPGRSVTVWGGNDAHAQSLRVGGTAGHLVNLDLSFGTTRVDRGVTVSTGGVLRGSGLLAAGSGLDVDTGGRVQVDAGQHMQLAVLVLNNRGQIRVQGTPLQPARLELAGALFNVFGAQTLVQHGRLDISNSSVIAGPLALESGQLAVGDDTVVNGRLLVSFGRSSVSGGLVNVGEVIVSNGAEASFYGALRNDGELRVSSGGAANFFGPVSGLGTFTGSGEARFEGGLTIGASPGVATINFNVTLNSALLAEIGGATPGIGDGHHDKIIFNGNVRLLDAPLNVVWWGGFTGALGDRYDLFDWNGSLTGTFSSLSLPVLADGLMWDTSDLYLGGTLGVAAVPEPATWALMLAGVAGVLARRRAGR